MSATEDTHGTDIGLDVDEQVDNVDRETAE